MMGQIDEFRRIRAQVKQAAIAEKLEPADVDRLDKDVKKFLDDPEVKDSFDSLEKASDSLVEANTEFVAMEKRDPEVCAVAKKISQANGKFVDIFPDGVPENYDFGSDGRIFEAVAKSLPTTQGAAKYLSDPKVVVDCVGEQIRQSELAHACLVALNNTRKCCEEFGNRHPWAKEYFEKAVAAGGYLADAAAIISSWAGGPATGIPVTAVVLVSRSEAGEAVANGVLDVLSNAAKTCARTDQEQQEFADTARFCVQTAGAANIVSSMGKFARHSPHPKNRPTPTESIAIRETELAGTGLKVKVPVEERISSVSRKMEGQGLGGKSTPEVLPKELAIPNRINPAMRAKVEKSCGVKMPENLVGYTKHGLDRALFKDEVGVSPQSILDTWNNPTKIEFEMDEHGGKFNIFGEKSMIAVNKNGKVITTRASTRRGYRITK
ncbi:MAG: hypothetical protein LBE98_03200 [Puniceicoccales bacterium]|jgi:hypothetical protein|nr:hypothetical protein [Puniceicoccales bacterium]